MSLLDFVLSRFPPDTRTPEQIAADTAESERLRAEQAAKRASDRAAYLAKAPAYGLKDGGVGRSHYLRGRCANGCEADRGKRVHVVPTTSSTALCGAKEGYRSVGWSDVLDEPASCPRCLAKLPGAKKPAKPSAPVLDTARLDALVAVKNPTYVVAIGGWTQTEGEPRKRTSGILTGDDGEHLRFATWAEADRYCRDRSGCTLDFTPLRYAYKNSPYGHQLWIVREDALDLFYAS